MNVSSLPKTVTRQRRDCDLNPGPSAPESSTLTTRIPSHPSRYATEDKQQPSLVRHANRPSGRQIRYTKRLTIASNFRLSD